MSHVFKNLEELAAMFDERCREESSRARLANLAEWVRDDAYARSSTWASAAYIVRHATITEDVSCREI